jgi:hypothetical protein
MVRMLESKVDFLLARVFTSRRGMDAETDMTLSPEDDLQGRREDYEAFLRSLDSDPPSVCDVRTSNVIRVQ